MSDHSLPDTAPAFESKRTGWQRFVDAPFHLRVFPGTLLMQGTGTLFAWTG